jgi:hypothetical protein
MARYENAVKAYVSQRLLHLSKQPEKAVNSRVRNHAKSPLPGPRFGADRVFLRLDCVAEIIEELAVLGSSTNLGYSEQLGKAMVPQVVVESPRPGGVFTSGDEQPLNQVLQSIPVEEEDGH